MGLDHYFRHMLRAWYGLLLYMAVGTCPFHTVAQSFTQTYGDLGTQDGLGTWIVGSGYRIAVRTVDPATARIGTQLYTMSASGALLSTVEVVLDDRFFPQRLLPSVEGHAFLIGSSIANSNTDHNGAVVRLAPSGEVEWVAVPELQGAQQYWGGVVLADGGVLVCGVHGEDNDHDPLVTLFNSEGNVVWSQVHEGPTDAEAYAVATDGIHILVTGRERTFSGNDDVFLMRMDLDGSVVWNNTLGGAGNELARAIVSSGGGGFVVAGHTNSYGVPDPETQQIRDHAYLAAIDLNGDTLWTRSIGDGTYHRQAYELVEAPGGDLVFAGELSTSASSDALLHRMTPNGTTIWERIVDTGKEERLIHALPLADAFVCTGWSFGPFGRQLLFIRRNAEGY